MMGRDIEDGRASPDVRTAFRRLRLSWLDSRLAAAEYRKVKADAAYLKALIRLEMAARTEQGR